MLAFDIARQVVVLFGGSCLFAGHYNDTWEWDGVNWAQRNPMNMPVGGAAVGMVYDALRAKTVLVQTLALGLRLWEWDGLNWVLRTSNTVPPVIGSQGIVYDTIRQRVVMIGASGAARWSWDGSDWTSQAVPNLPSVGATRAVTFDSNAGALLAFGGDDKVRFWRLSEIQVLGTAQSYGVGCGAPALGLADDSLHPPRMGRVARAVVLNSPSPVVAISLGWDNQSFGSASLPMPLDSLGMAGCTLYQSADAMGLAVSATQPPQFQASIPNASVVLGLRCYLQAYALAPGQNSTGVIVSNGLQWRFGNL